MTNFVARSLLLMTLVALTGCAARGTNATPLATGAPDLATSAVGQPSMVSVAVASNDFPVGQPRLPFVLVADGRPLADVQSAGVIAFNLATGTPVPGWSGFATGYLDYAVPYWVAYPELPQAGLWGFVADITLADGAKTQTQFTIEVALDPSAPAIGEMPPASQNRTLDGETELAALTSDPAPEAGLYEMTVAEAITSGRPSVVTFATPGFCESRLCSPVVDSVKAVRGAVGDQANFIHLEVYKTFDPLVYADEMDEWHMPSEPWTFVLDSTGQVAARLGGPVSPRELTEILTPLLSP